MRTGSGEDFGRGPRIGAVFTGLIVFAVFLVFSRPLLGAAPAGAADASLEAAREHYNRGLDLASQGEYRRAADEFKAAYEASPHFATLYNIAQADLAIGRVQEAADAFRRYLVEGGDQIPAERREQVTRHLALIEARFASLTLETDPPGATVQVDGADVGRTPLSTPLRLAPGTHAVSASLAGHQSVTRAVTLGEGEGRRMAFALPKLVAPTAAAVAPERAAPAVVAPGRADLSRQGWAARPAPWLIGAGVVAGGAAAVIYAWNRGRYELYQQEESQLPTDTTPGRRDRVIAHNDLGDSIHRTSVVSASLAVAGLVLVVAGAGWLIVDARRPPSEREGVKGERAHAFALDVAADRASLLWGGAW